MKVIIVEIGRQNALQVPLVQGDYMVQKLAPDAADQALDVRVLPRRVRGGEHLFGAERRR
jgi:hypothetical protein